MIDTENITAFLEHLSGRTGSNSRNCDVSYSPVTGEYDVMNAGSKKNLNLIVIKREYPDPKDPSRTITRTDSKATRLAH
jgi:hypothetical protein